jgi:predicted GNAT family acetyltransferase
MASILKSLGAGLQNVGGVIAGTGSSNTGGAVGTGSSGAGSSNGGAVSGSGSGTSCASTTQEQQQQQQHQHQQQQKQQQPSQETWPVSHDAARQRFAIALPLAAAPSTGLAGGIAGLGMGTKPAPQASEAYLSYRTLGSATCVGAALLQAASCQQVELVNIFVPDEFRKRGVAASLVLALLNYANDKGICDVRVASPDVRSYLEQAMAVWAAAGFEPMLSSRKATGEAAQAPPAQAPAAPVQKA